MLGMCAGGPGDHAMVAGPGSHGALELVARAACNCLPSGCQGPGPESWGLSGPASTALDHAIRQGWQMPSQTKHHRQQRARFGPTPSIHQIAGARKFARCHPRPSALLGECLDAAQCRALVPLVPADCVLPLVAAL